MVSALGHSVNDASIWNGDGQLISETKLRSDNWLQMIRFAEGNHFAFIKYPEIINKAISDHLVKLKNSEPQSSSKEFREVQKLRNSRQIRL